MHGLRASPSSSAFSSLGRSTAISSVAVGQCPITCVPLILILTGTCMQRHDKAIYPPASRVSTRRTSLRESPYSHRSARFHCLSLTNGSLQTALAFAISFVGDLDALIGYVMFGFWAQVRSDSLSHPQLRSFSFRESSPSLLSS